MQRSLVIVFAALFLSWSSYGLANTPTLANWAFTDQIINSAPATELDITSMEIKDIFVFTSWKDLDIEFYEVEARIYDGENKLVGYSKYGFKPDKRTWDSWTRYHFRPGIDQPGEWRFVVSINGQRALEETIYIEP